MKFCCWCGEVHKKKEDCWLNSEEAKNKLWKPIIEQLLNKRKV